MPDLEPTWEFKNDDNLWAVRLSRDGQMLVVGSWDSNAYALDRSGSQLWQHKTSDYVKGIGLSRDGDVIVVGSYDRYIYAIKQSGKLSWRYKTENYVRAVAVSDDGEYVAAGSWRGTIYLLDKRGKLLWKHRIGTAILDLAISENGATIAAGTEDGSLHVFDSGGTQKWNYKCGGTVMNVAVSSPGNRVVAAAKDTLLTCLNGQGEPLWKFPLGGISRGLYLVQEDEIAVALTDNNFIQYIDSNGELIFMRRLPDEIWDGAVAADGVSIAIATKDNRTLFFECKELANIILEKTQHVLEKVVSENIDITKAQEMHQAAGKLLTGDEHGEAIKLALEAERLCTEIRESTLGDRARSIVQQVEGLVGENPNLDMRKARRYLEKSRKALQEERLQRVLFYGDMAKAAAEDSIEKEAPMVEDELFAASLASDVDTDENAINRLLGIDVPEEEIEEMPEEQPSHELADEVADEIGDMVEGAAEPEEEATEAEVGEAYDEFGGIPDEGEVPKEGEMPGEGEEEDLGPAPDEGPADTSEDEDLGPAPDEPPQEPEAGSEYEEIDRGEDEAGEGLEGGEDDAGEEIIDVCPQCGELAGTIDDKCASCYSDEIMKLAVEKAKLAHKEGHDIYALAGDLKAVKVARQSRDYDDVVEISKRLLDQIEATQGEKFRDDRSGPRKKKKKKKRLQ